MLLIQYAGNMKHADITSEVICRFWRTDMQMLDTAPQAPPAGSSSKNVGSHIEMSRTNFKCTSSSY